MSLTRSLLCTAKMGLRKVTYANGARSSGRKVLRSTEARGFPLWPDVRFSTISSYANDLQAGTPAALTRGMATSMTRDAVFNTNELLEAILLNLSIEDLLTARHVNQHWNLLIVRSPRLRRNLFLLQAPKYHFWTYDRMTEDLREYTAGDSTRFGKTWTERQNVALPSIVNPIFFKENGPGVKGSMVHRARYCESMYFKASPDLKKLDSLVNEMFLALPAPREVEFKFYYHRRKPKGRRSFYGNGCVKARVKNKYGVTLAQILQAFWQEAEKKRIMKESVEDYVICTHSSAVWMFGHVFPTQEELDGIKAKSVWM